VEVLLSFELDGVALELVVELGLELLLRTRVLLSADQQAAKNPTEKHIMTKIICFIIIISSKINI
jgi:hypothetical protein